MLDFNNIDNERAINATIRSLHLLRENIDNEINQLEQKKQVMLHVANEKKRLNRIINDYIEMNPHDNQGISMLIDNGFKGHRLKEAHSVFKRIADNKRRLIRDQEILRRFQLGIETKSDIARTFGISRQALYKIINQAKENIRHK